MGDRPGSAIDPRGRHHPLSAGLSSVRVALVAQRASVEMHADGPLLLEAFDRLGIHASIVPWGSGAAWATFGPASAVSLPRALTKLTPSTAFASAPGYLTTRSLTSITGRAAIG